MIIYCMIHNILVKFHLKAKIQIVNPQIKNSLRILQLPNWLAWWIFNSASAIATWQHSDTALADEQKHLTPFVRIRFNYEFWIM